MHGGLLVMKRVGIALVVVTGLLAAARVDAIVLSCRQGQPGSERVRGLKTDDGPYDRSYPFCLLETPLDDGCEFTFCPDLGAVVGCALIGLRCPVADCRDPEASREAFAVKPAGPHRRGLLRLERGGKVIVLECRPPLRHRPL